MVSSGYGRTLAAQRMTPSLAAALVALAGTAVMAQPGKGTGSRSREQLVNLSRVENLYVGPGGVRPGPFDPGPWRACNALSSHAVASAFNVGSQVNMQAGMIAGESFAATYTLPASDFPLRISMTEVLFASQASLTTTTAWTITYWSGLPTTGTQVASFSSDGTILPHVSVAGGCAPQACATLMQFAVEPTDPEQIIIADDGSHSFTVAIRIDQFNTPTSCSQSPPSSSNAFLCTDVGGLNQGANNWLGAVPCPLGCPAGWTRFSSLNVFCRPSGDWVSRTTWTSLSCTPGVGACCLPNGTCLDGQAQSACTGQNGTFQGDGSTCGTVTCPQPSAACCFTNGQCLNMTSVNCSTAGGNWLPGSSCSGSTCPTGSCCLPMGQCLSGVTSAECSTQGGTFRGVGTTCASPCPQPSGACCLSNGNCLTLTQVDCGVIPGSNWAGALTSCATACAQPCYANCDTSTGSPVLTANDFQCFLNRFAAGQSYANCDQSTGTPNLTANDFQCFLDRFASGCT